MIKEDNDNNIIIIICFLSRAASREATADERAAPRSPVHQLAPVHISYVDF